MAKRKYSGMKRNKIEPAVQTLTFSNIQVDPNAAVVKYIDLSQVASLVNRRFYRQGINWAVGGMKLLSEGGSTGGIVIGKLPNTWVMSNAWVKGFKAWQHMISNAVEDSGMESIKGRFLDFKIFADAGHHQAGMAANLIPNDVNGGAGGNSTYVQGDWLPSKYEIPASGGSTTTAKRDIIAVGPNVPGVSPATGSNAVSLIQGYADSRALPYQQDPNVPVDADTNWMLALFNEGSSQAQEVVVELEVSGDQPPYPFEGDGVNPDTMYPGGETNATALQMHDIEFITSSTIGGTTRLKGGNFPCGLMQVTISNTSVARKAYSLQIDLIPGSHRGYLCESMMEM